MNKDATFTPEIQLNGKAKNEFQQAENILYDNSESAGKQTKRQQVERFLQQRFTFRFNDLTGGVEYTRINQHKWSELTDYKLNSICRVIDKEQGLSVPAGLLIEYLRSDFVPSYHPLQEYLRSLPARSGTAAIDALASTVKVKNPDLFRETLTRWLVASVANVFEPNGCQNQTCFVLTGGQGAFKSTWLNLLCPADLLKYSFCGKIDLQSKDTYILLGTMFIINLDDQLRALNKKDDETLKTIITHPNINVRRPYDKYPSYLSRIASFCGSINSNEFLTDPTGSRRFLPFEVESIDIDRAKEIDMNQVWAEAYTLIKQPDFKYWFTVEDFAQMFGNNEDFQVATEEYELLHEYYEVVSDAKHASVHLSNTKLLSQLQTKTRSALSSKRLGEALKKSKGIQRTLRASGGSKVWYLRERSEDEIRERSKAELPVEVSAVAVTS